MMRAFLIPILLLTGIISCTQSKHPVKAPQKEQAEPIQWEARRDTILEEKPYGSVYITNDTTVKYYDWLVPPDMRSMDADYQQQYEGMTASVLDTHGVKLRHFPMGDFPLKWSPLHFYNGHFYVYSPSDWMAHSSEVITDSVIYRIETDLYNAAAVIGDAQRLSPAAMKFKLLDDEGTYYLNIRIVDQKRGIAVWEIMDKNNELVGRSLRVDARKVRQFPMIIEDCGDQKCVFSWQNFSEPDYDSLIKNAH